jgi:hypothetical protein
MVKPWLVKHLAHERALLVNRCIRGNVVKVIQHAQCSSGIECRGRQRCHRLGRLQGTPAGGVDMLINLVIHKRLLQCAQFSAHARKEQTTMGSNPLINLLGAKYATAHETFMYAAGQCKIGEITAAQPWQLAPAILYPKGGSRICEISSSKEIGYDDR